MHLSYIFFNSVILRIKFLQFRPRIEVLTNSVIINRNHCHIISKFGDQRTCTLIPLQLQ